VVCTWAATLGSWSVQPIALEVTVRTSDMYGFRDMERYVESGLRRRFGRYFLFTVSVIDPKPGSPC